MADRFVPTSQLAVIPGNSQQRSGTDLRLGGACRLPQGLDCLGTVQLPELESLRFGEKGSGRLELPGYSGIEGQPPLGEVVSSVRLEQDERAVVRESPGIGGCLPSPFDRGEGCKAGHLFLDPGKRFLESGNSQVGCALSDFLQALRGQFLVLAQ